MAWPGMIERETQGNFEKFDIPFGDGETFPLAFDRRLTLTPEQTTVFIAKKISERLGLAKRKDLRMLEMGVGSGIFMTSLILNSEPDKFSFVQVSDIDGGALNVAEFNIRRAMAIHSAPETQLALTRSNWFKELNFGRYDLIYAAPPFRTKPLREESEYIQNPDNAIYAPTFSYHYEQIIDAVTDYVHEGSVVVLRPPRADDKVAYIRGYIASRLNMGFVECEETEFEKGKFIILTFK